MKMRYGRTYVGGVGDQGAGLKVERWTTREKGGDELQTPFFLELDSPPYETLEKRGNTPFQQLHHRLHDEAKSDARKMRT